MIRRLFTCRLNNGKSAGCLILIFWFYASHRFIFTRLSYDEEVDEFRNSANVARLIWETNYTILHEPLLENCRKSVSKKSVIVAVTSAPGNANLRRVIRRTWGAEFKRRSFGLIFVVGRSENVTLNRNLKEEWRTYKDILAVDFMDNYYNLSLKTLLAMDWCRTYFRNCDAEPKYFLKADDDVYLFADNILRFLDENGNVTSTAWCHRFEKPTVQRDKSNNKRYVSHLFYPRRYYPNCCSGHAYLMTMDSLTPIVNYVRQLHMYVFLEDVLFTGLAAEAVGVRRVHDFRFQWWAYDTKGVWSYRTKLDNAFSLHYVKTPEAMESLVRKRGHFL